MFKHLTLAFCAGTLFTGCVITTGDTDATLGDSDNNSNSTPQTGGNTEVLTGGDTTAEPATESAEAGTTAETPTSEPTSEPITTSTDPSGTTGGALYGNCGWKESDISYYSCTDEEGTVPGLEDPMGMYPIMCPEGLVAGDPCVDDMPVSGVGCCTPEGHLFFCDADTNPDMPVIFEQDCG